VLRLDGSWESELYASGEGEGASRQTRAHTGLTWTNWLQPALRLSVSAALDAWNGAQRSVSLGGAVERFVVSDSVSVSAGATLWKPFTASGTFQSMEARLGWRRDLGSNGSFGGVTGFQTVGGSAPLMLWPGAGEGYARAVLLRAHPLLEGGAIAGAMLGRQLAHGSAEATRWFGFSFPARVGIAGFVDAARASSLADGSPGVRMEVDAGIGLRVKLPAQSGTLRVDLARGLRDGAQALTIGVQF
jgi:hypothetical protein